MSHGATPGPDASCVRLPRDRPCVRCPWARTTSPGEFPLRKYEQLRATVGAPGREVPLGAPLFACHKTGNGREVPCAGWLAAVGRFHLTVRYWIVRRWLPPDAVHPKEGWPELFYEYDELVRVQAATVGDDT